MNVEQSYHLEPEKGLLNDPVGLVWFRDHYHVFFQWNSLKKDHSHKEWAHMTSSDLIHWTHHESPLVPSQSYDQNGVYSGSSCVNNGRLFSYYTGNRKENGIRTVKQCLAISQDGIHFEKKGPVLDVPEGYTQHFRDPRVLWLDDQYVMLIGAQNLEQIGCILLFTSADGYSWTFSHLVGTTRQYNMVECPDLVCLDGKQVLIYSPQGRDPVTDQCLESFSVYQILDQSILDTDHLDLDTGWTRLESGFDGYAPQSLMTPDRHLVFTWMNRLDEQQEKQLAAMADHIHCLSLPRELSLKENRLFQKPAPELYSLFEENGILLQNLPCLPGRQWMMRIPRIQNSFCLNIGSEAALQWESQSQTFTFSRNWPAHSEEKRSLKLTDLSCLEIFMDQSSLEIFVNSGEHVLSARLLPQSPFPPVQLKNGSCQAFIHHKKDCGPFIV